VYRPAGIRKPAAVELQAGVNEGDSEGGLATVLRQTTRLQMIVGSKGNAIIGDAVASVRFLQGCAMTVRHR
jgi:hypothetical protein